MTICPHKLSIKITSITVQSYCPALRSHLLQSRVIIFNAICIFSRSGFRKIASCGPKVTMWYGIMNLCRQAGMYLAIYIHLVAFGDLLNWEIKECTLSLRFFST